jgi:hypothetical protein
MKIINWCCFNTLFVLLIDTMSNDWFDIWKKLNSRWYWQFEIRYVDLSNTNFKLEVILAVWYPICRFIKHTHHQLIYSWWYCSRLSFLFHPSWIIFASIIFLCSRTRCRLSKRNYPNTFGRSISQPALISLTIY